MCPQLTIIDVMNAINNMTSNIIHVYRDESNSIWFYIQITCGVDGNPHISCGYTIGSADTVCSSEFTIPECINRFNEKVRNYYEKNWYKFQ